MDLRVKDIMKPRVETVDQDETAEAAYDRMKRNRIHHLVVTGAEGIVGVLSERDLGGRDREVLRQTHRVANVMTPYAVKARPEMTVRQAAGLMRGWTIGCLPVVDRGKLVGIVTISDLLDLVARGAGAEPRPGAPRPLRPRDGERASSGR
jgi:acetoin utilization protein AcuB